MTGTTLGLLSAGLALAAGAGWVLGLRAVRLTGRRRLFVSLFATALLLGLLALFREPGWLGGAAASLGVLAGALFCGVNALSGQVRRAPAVQVGGRFLDFEAVDETGQPFLSSSLRGAPFLAKFFRGHW